MKFEYTSLNFSSYVCTLILFSSFLTFKLSAVGQETQTGFRIDNLSNLNCENQRAQLDVLIAKTIESSDSKGIIIIHGETGDLTSAYKQKARVHLHLKIRGANADKFIILLGRSEHTLRTELWVVPRQEMQRFSGEPWNFKIADLEEPINVNAESWTKGEGCYFTFDLKFYSQFLVANDDLTGRIVIRDKTFARFNKVRSRIVNELASEYKVSLNRLEFAFIQSDWSDIEHWYLPRDYFPRP